jgi:hypothetical protein
VDLHHALERRTRVADGRGDGAPGREPQLFLADDPGDEGDEKQDRAAERPDVVRELRAELLAWLAQLELADAFVTLRDLR